MEEFVNGRINYELLKSKPEAEVPLLLLPDHIGDQVLRVLLPLLVVDHFGLDVSLVEVVAAHYPLHDHLLQVVRQAEELLLVQAIDGREDGRADY